MRIIAGAIREAWARMLVDCRETATQAIEAEVNGALVTHMQDALRERSPFSSLVHSVLRGIEQYNYDGTHFEKRPDLNILFRRRDGSFPLAAECKIIDHGNGQSVHKYDINGIARFQNGDYGWFHRQGFMVAYVRDATLAEAAIHRVTGAAPARWPTQRGEHFHTTHARTFRYVGREPGEDAPGDIDLIHVWLTDASGTDQT
jgi:hypothetical protein